MKHQQRHLRDHASARPSSNPVSPIEATTAAVEPTTTTPSPKQAVHNLNGQNIQESPVVPALSSGTTPQSQHGSGDRLPTPSMIQPFSSRTTNPSHPWEYSSDQFGDLYLPLHDFTSAATSGIGFPCDPTEYHDIHDVTDGSSGALERYITSLDPNAGNAGSASSSSALNPPDDLSWTFDPSLPLFPMNDDNYLLNTSSAPLCTCPNCPYQQGRCGQ